MQPQPFAGFKPPTDLANWTKWSLLAQVIVTAAAVVSNLLEYRLLSDFDAGIYSSQALAVEAGEANDARQGMVGLAQVAVFVVSGILILMWIHRANHNARALGADRMSFSPGWSVGWYFIPIMNLWKPYQAMKEIWQASADPRHWTTQEVPNLLPWWWFFWLVSGISGNISLRLALQANTLDELMMANLMVQLSDVTAIPLSLVFLAIVKRVHEMQMAHAEPGGAAVEPTAYAEGR